MRLPSECWFLGLIDALSARFTSCPQLFPCCRGFLEAKLFLTKGICWALNLGQPCGKISKTTFHAAAPGVPPRAREWGTGNFFGVPPNLGPVKKWPSYTNHVRSLYRSDDFFKGTTYCSVSSQQNNETQLTGRHKKYSTIFVIFVIQH